MRLCRSPRNGRTWRPRLIWKMILVLLGNCLQNNRQSQEAHLAAQYSARRLKPVFELIAHDFADPITVADAVSIAGLSRWHFMRLFQTGDRPVVRKLRAALSDFESPGDPGLNGQKHFRCEPANRFLRSELLWNGVSRPGQDDPAHVQTAYGATWISRQDKHCGYHAEWQDWGVLSRLFFDFSCCTNEDCERN